MDTIPLVYPESDDTYLIIDSLEQEISEGRLSRLQNSISVEVGPGGGSVSKSFLQGCAKAGLRTFHLAIDVNMHAAKETLAVCEGLRLGDCINGEGLSFFRPSFQAEIVFCNPPYVPSSPLNRARDIRASYAGGERGREMIDAIFPAVKAKLKPEGMFYLLLESRNDVPEVLRAAGMESRFVKQKRIRGEHLLVYCFTAHR
jgi:release factor glutamine methyltransferase